MSNARNLARLIVDSGGDLDTSNLGNAPNPINAGTIAYLGMSTAPTGWIKANGAAITVAAYPDLYGAIGSTYNTGGEPAGTFRLPDLRGEFPRGWDDGRGVDSGRVFGATQDDQFQGHEHTQRWVSGSPYGIANANIYSFATNPSATTGIVAGSNGTPKYGNETRPRNVALLACIKY